jgi:hypothetical protein
MTGLLLVASCDRKMDQKRDKSFTFAGVFAWQYEVLISTAKAAWKFSSTLKISILETVTSVVIYSHLFYLH